MVKQLLPSQALSRAESLCSAAEYCSFDIRRKLTSWGVTGTDAEAILSKLISARYIDDSRYAEAFVRDKVRFAHWGRNKVAFSLRRKCISDDIISRALALIADDELSSGMEMVMRGKLRTLKYKDAYDARNKLLRFGVSRGFDFGSLSSLVAKLVREIDSDADVDDF